MRDRRAYRLVFLALCILSVITLLGGAEDTHTPEPELYEGDVEHTTEVEHETVDVEHSESGGGHNKEALINLMLGLGLALVLAKLFAEGFEHIKQPAVIGEIIAGMILGPQLLGGIIGVDILNENFAAFAEIGVMVLLFLSGLEVELDKLKSTGKLAGAAAVGGVALPFVGGYAIGMYFYGGSEYAFTISMLLGALLTATSVGVTARILIDLKSLNTRAGTTILGAAVIDDVLGIIVLVIVSGIAATGALDVMSVFWLMAGILVYFFITGYLGLKIINPLAEFKNKMVSQNAFIALTIAMALIFGVFAEEISIAAITGAFIAGLILGETPYRHKLTEEAKVIGYGFFIPIFFVYTGAGVDFSVFGGAIGIMLVALLIAILGKLIGCGGIAKLFGSSNIESTVIGVGMIPRMEIGLVVASIGISLSMAGDPAGTLAREIFSLAVFVSIMTGFIPMLFLRPLLKRYRKEVMAEGEASIEESET